MTAFIYYAGMYDERRSCVQTRHNVANVLAFLQRPQLRGVDRRSRVPTDRQDLHRPQPTRQRKSPVYFTLITHRNIYDDCASFLSVEHREGSPRARGVYITAPQHTVCGYRLVQSCAGQPRTSTAASRASWATELIPTGGSVSETKRKTNIKTQLQ